MQVFGSSGTRGIVNESLSPDFIMKVAKAAGTMWSAERVAIGRDTRKTGLMFANAAASGLASVGVSVDRLGVIPTPGIQAYAERNDIPGIVITASHNPPEYNGVKLIGSDGKELSVNELERVESILLSEQFDNATWDQVGNDTDISNSITAYLDDIKRAVNLQQFKESQLRIAVDPGHGAGLYTSPRLFRELGCEVVTVNAHDDGHFPGRDPEPIAENLAALGDLVKAANADIGIAHDGDADRAIFFDESGEYIEGDATLAALADAKLTEGDITVSAVNVSQRLVNVVDETNASLELTQIGSTRIMNRIQELQKAGNNVPIAGEGNGGVIFPHYRLARDGAYTAVKFIELLTNGQTASEVVNKYDDYHNVRINIHYESENERETLLGLAEETAIKADGEITTIDGYRIDYGDAWILVRPSGTEPVVRIYAESKSKQRAENIASSMAQKLREAIDDA
ncbi:MAG: phosphoglucosamine mutase [Halobacteriaceae archaeon]